MTEPFLDRAAAGALLADALMEYGNRSNVAVLGLPRGGVPIAYEIATRLDATLDIVLVRKLGVPRQSELAMGAVASGGVRVLNEEILLKLNIPHELVEAV